MYREFINTCMFNYHLGPVVAPADERGRRELRDGRHVAAYVTSYHVIREYIMLYYNII